jgi:hypothetical protein
MRLAFFRVARRARDRATRRHDPRWNKKTGLAGRQLGNAFKPAEPRAEKALSLEIVSHGALFFDPASHSTQLSAKKSGQLTAKSFSANSGRSEFVDSASGRVTTRRSADFLFVGSAA